MNRKVLEVVDPTVSPPVWAALRNQAEITARAEPALASLVDAVVLRHDTLTDALCYQLARKLGDEVLTAIAVLDICEDAHRADAALVEAAEADIRAVFERDPAS
jgi:serine O-acetyltransferase